MYNFSGKDLSGRNFTGEDLSGADLSQTNLSGADLMGANLAGADMSHANLSGANLRRSCWRHTYVKGVEFDSAQNIIQLGPVGPRGDIVYAVAWPHGIMVKCNYFWGPCRVWQKQSPEYVGIAAMLQSYAQTYW